MRPRVLPHALPRSLPRHLAVLALAGLLALAPVAAQAQLDGGDAELMDDGGGSRLSTEAAARLLAEPLPDQPGARLALLRRQYAAALATNERGRLVTLARQMADDARSEADWESWLVTYINNEFTWGVSGQAVAAAETFLADPALTPRGRAMIALRRTYFAATGDDRAILENQWSRAERLVAAATAAAPEDAALRINFLQVRAEIERWRGDTPSRVATMREALRLSRQHYEAQQKHPAPDDPLLANAFGRYDSSQGMLVYALVRQGRAPEAIRIAEDNFARWRSGEISDSAAARWHYRYATALNAVQRYADAHDAARRAGEMLLQSGASGASYTRWLAQQELVQALIGLRRWGEADAAYREFLATMPADQNARSRASDWRLQVLLAAKNGRGEDALKQVERIYRYRLRLFGAAHAQTREAVGIRAVVRLARGETRLALADFEELFAATLDTTAGWHDLELRGARGYLFGIAFDDFMRYVAEQARRGEPLPPAVSDRALQLADRLDLGVTQRALTDSTARVLAASPALRALLEEEQTLRRALSAQFAQVSSLLGEEDELRKTSRSEEFKALPVEQRKAHREKIEAVHAEVAALQAAAGEAQGRLEAQRETIARQFPAYADLVAPTTPSREQLRSLLEPGEAVLVLHPTATATLLWLIRADGDTRFAASPLTASELEPRVATLLADLGPDAALAGQAPPLAGLHALYRDLLGPVAAGLDGVGTLFVASTGALAGLPAAALVTAPPDDPGKPAWLVRRMAVAQIPSASALFTLRRVREPVQAAKALYGFGDPQFKPPAAPAGKAKAKPGTKPAAARSSGRKGERVIHAAVDAKAVQYDAEQGFQYGKVPALPETRAELTAIAGALGADPRRDLVFGAQATRQAVLAAPLADRRVVAFATHGLLPGELPGLAKPALAMAANADPAESPLLDLDDVLGLRLNAQTVLLSACNTGAGVDGERAMSGLVRAFFFAGSRSVLATHWAVDSDSAGALTAAAFRNQGQGRVSRGEGLRQAQLAMIDGRLGGGRWRHPFFWAPYALFGDPRR